MNPVTSLFLMILSFWTMFISTSAIAAAIDPAAAVVKVRVSCTENTMALDNCFANLWDLTTWIRTVRLPNASKPLKVEIRTRDIWP